MSAAEVGWLVGLFELEELVLWKPGSWVDQIANAFREVIECGEFARRGWSVVIPLPSMRREQRPGRLGDIATRCSAHALKCRWRMQLD